MILAAITSITIITWILMGIFGIVCFLMSVVILMQRPKNEGLGAAFGSGTTDQLFGARTTNVLQKATVYLGTMFFVLVLLISVLISRQVKRVTLVADAKPAAAATAPANPEATPDSEDGGPLEIAPAPAPVKPEGGETTPPPVEKPADESAPKAPETVTPPAEKPAEETAPKAPEPAAPPVEKPADESAPKAPETTAPPAEKPAGE